jgi:putative ABC transport system permease protein
MMQNEKPATPKPRSFAARLPLALRYALRDLIGDPRGFGVFVACIAIGVAAISGVEGLSFSLAQGLAHEGRALLGGDVSISVSHRDFSDEQRAYLTTHGHVDEIALMRGMARLEIGEAQRETPPPALLEIKAVDAALYPPFGALEAEPALSVAAALAKEGETFGLIADSLLMARLDAKLGDRLAIGEAHFVIRAVTRAEPDKLSGGLGYGSRVLISHEALRATGLVRPGTIIRYLARVTLPGAPSDEDATGFVEAANKAFPQAGWDIRKRDAVSPQFSKNLERFTQLLTLVALTALVAGGAGVANAVQGLVLRKRQAFAVLKALGAPASRVFAIALWQVLTMATLAIAIGLCIGAVMPFAAGEALRRALELPIAIGVDYRGLALGAFYGLLVALVFALPPLGRAHDVPVAALLRDDRDSDFGKAPLRYRLAALGAAATLAAVVFVTAADKTLAAAFVASVLGAFLLLRGVAWLVMRAAQRLPRARDARLRLAQGNIARQGSLAPTLIVSAGVTVTLMVALALVEGAIHAELERSGTGAVPDFYFIDVPKEEAGAFSAFIEEEAPGSHVEHVPMMRGRIVAVKGARAETLHPGEDAAWALEGDRGITFSAEPPEGARIVEGEWWAKDTKEKLVSMEERVAKGLGLSIGDEISVNVLGREIAAKLVNLRKVEWRSYAINFVMVFSPATFAGAPHSELFTARYPVGADAKSFDARLARETAKRYPMVAAVHVKEALEAVDKIATQLALAARAAAGIAILTAVLALGSAVAASERARIHDAVVLKTLGATRAWLVASNAMEFLCLSVAASLFALAAGIGAAYAITEYLMKMHFVFLPGAIALTTLAALAATLVIGLAGVWRALSRKPGPELRSL